jgi:hypothetical protein
VTASSSGESTANLGLVKFRFCAPGRVASWAEIAGLCKRHPGTTSRKRRGPAVSCFDCDQCRQRAEQRHGEQIRRRGANPQLRGGDSGGAKRVAADLRGENGCRLLHRAWAQTTRACPKQLRRDVTCRSCSGQVPPVFRHAAPGRANWDAQSPLVYLPSATRRGAAPDTPRRRSCFCRRKSPRPGRRRPNASSARARGWHEILRQSPGGA